MRRGDAMRAVVPNRACGLLRLAAICVFRAGRRNEHFLLTSSLTSLSPTLASIAGTLRLIHIFLQTSFHNHPGLHAPYETSFSLCCISNAENAPNLFVQKLYASPQKGAADMPLIVGNSQTMSSPSERSVKRPSKQETSC